MISRLRALFIIFRPSNGPVTRLGGPTHRQSVRSHKHAGHRQPPMLQPDQVTDPLNAYQLSKRGNVLRVMAEAVRWGRRGARVNAISPCIIITPLARDELTGRRGEGYGEMLSRSPAGRAGNP